ncbi:MAG: hypothetical protein WAT29_10140 [Thiolinea sp.]
MYEVKKAIYKVFNKWNSEYPAVAIRQESRMLLMEEGLNKFSASDVDKINFDWIKELREEARFVHAFHRPLVGDVSGGSGARGNPYRRRLPREKLNPDWRFWGMMPNVTLQQAVFLSIGVEPDVQHKLMREVDKARRYQHYAEARELLILNDMIVTRQRIAEKYVSNEELTLMEFLTILDRLQVHYSGQFKLAAQRAEENRILLGCISRKDEIHSLAINNRQLQEPTKVPMPIKGNKKSMQEWIVYMITQEKGLSLDSILHTGLQQELINHAIGSYGYKDGTAVKTAWAALGLKSAHKTT